MDFTSEQSAEQSPAAEAELEVSTSTPGSASPPPPREKSSDSTAPTPTPPSKTVESVRRTVVNVAVDAGARVISGAWLYFHKFDKPVNKRGQNTQCQVKENPEADICGRLYKHMSGNGTTPLLEHLKNNHPAAYKIAMESSTKSKEAKAKKGQAYATAAASCE